jgi:GT2 family glycosyltransferase
VTVLVVTYRGADLLPGCLDALRAQTRPHRLLVVDNASTDGTAALLASRYPEARVVRLPANAGFAGGVAAGLAGVDTEYVALLNDDAVPAPGWLEALVRAAAADERVAGVTSRLLLPGTRPARLNNAGVAVGRDGYGRDVGLGEPDGPPYDVPGEVFGFSGGAALLRVAPLRAVGGFPARFFLYYEDTDTAWRLRLAGWQIRYEPAAAVRHLHSASTDQRSASFAFHNERNRLLMLTRCAPAGLAARQVLRFPTTTASLAVKRAVRRPLPAGHQFRLGLRLRVLGSYLRLLPWALSERRRIGRLATVSRREVAARWLGYTDRSYGHPGGWPPEVRAQPQAAGLKPCRTGGRRRRRGRAR